MARFGQQFKIKLLAPYLTLSVALTVTVTFGHGVNQARDGRKMNHHRVGFGSAKTAVKIPVIHP